MRTLRQAEQRGHTEIGWLDSNHTFSFGGYRDPNHMNFRALRVINDDRVIGGAGFGAHPHDNMEIISYVVEGGLEHKDSMGTGSVIRPGEVQLMSAGSGVVHSEFNASEDEQVRFLQIWLPPAKRGLQPTYQQRYFDPAERDGKLVELITPDGRDETLKIRRDTRILGGTFGAGQTQTVDIDAGRHVWIQVVKGRVTVDGQQLREGDGLGISEESSFTIAGVEGGELLVFDLD
ncbi:MAG: pirin family protein [Myxococcota bacterium]